MSKSYIEIESNQLSALLERGALRMNEYEARLRRRRLAYGRRYLRVRFAAWRGKPLNDQEVLRMVDRDWSSPWGEYPNFPLFRKLASAAKTSPKVLLCVDELAYINRWCYHVKES